MKKTVYMHEMDVPGKLELSELGPAVWSAISKVAKIVGTNLPVALRIVRISADTLVAEMSDSLYKAGGRKWRKPDSLEYPGIVNVLAHALTEKPMTKGAP